MEFFSAWTYWLISWVSSIAVILAFVGYLSPLICITEPLALLFLEILLITLVTGLNILGVRVVGSMEFYLTILKCLPLIIIPLLGFFYFEQVNLHPLYDPNTTLLTSLNTSTLMTFWGFIGIEMANILSTLTENPQKNVPRAIIFGTLIVAFIYIFSNLGIIGVLPRQILSQSAAPFAEVGRIIFGFGWEQIISVFALLACLGTLNAWVLASGQVAMASSKEGLFPAIFSKTNRFGSPYMSLLISLYAIVPILFLTMCPSILTQLNYIIDVSVLTFVIIYLLSMVSFIKISFQEVLLHNLKS
jgi:APA family basic amino acid/polyamine antiporter